MATDLAISDLNALEKALIVGDLSKLSDGERVAYYKSVCESVGLNPLTRPFDYIVLNGKLTLYARKDATEQLRKLHGVSTAIVGRETTEGVYVVTARAVDHAGRSEESIGAVPIEGLKGEARANALMKAETKAKRRVTLAICGLGFLDETEAESIPGAIRIETDTGEILPARPALTSGRAEPMPQHVAIEAMVGAVNGEKREYDQLVAYAEQRDLTIGDACRRLGIANTPRGLREALREIGLDALKDRLDASLDADAAQPALDGMPAVERTAAHDAVGSH